MAEANRLKVVLCWHMHQPPYRDASGGDYQLPWVYLHAIKDYVDMAAHLEAHPAARAVINFAPVLLDQIADYATRVEKFLADGQPPPDPLLAALGQPMLPLDEARLPLIKACLRANETHLIARFPAYQRLADLAVRVLAHPASNTYLTDQFLADLLVWYHLAWLGETVRRNDARVQRLIAKAGGYTPHDRRELLVVIGELLSGVIPRYRRLAEAGRVELSFTPYAHPILPLLLDFAVAREALPDASLPQVTHYPDGAERARWHLREGIETFRRHFGFTPRGCWPAEGALSEAACALIHEAGLEWTASGEAVLRHTLAHAGHAPHAMKEAWLHHPYTGPGGIRCFFRDDGLSDLIGFTYATWHADDAVNGFVQHLETIADRCTGHPDRVVSVILDGENAWEYYPENGYYFLARLYQRLSDHPRLALTTFADCLAHGADKRLPRLVAGSWVYGTLSTWIGDADKNRGWEMLGDAARAYAAAAPTLDPDQRAAAARALAVCEASDWFWWFGNYNPAVVVSDFERLYRRHLTHLYRLLGQEPPEYLAHVFARGAGSPLRGGVMRPGA